MTVADTEPDVDEGAKVLSWRAHVLVRAGFDPDLAFALAEREDVDLHQAVYLLEAGCPVDTAIRILT